MRSKNIIVAVALAGVIGLCVVRRSATQSPLDPQDAVYAMLDAARAGDVKEYLGSYTGSTEAALRRTAAEDPAFSKYLRSSLDGVKGIVVSEPQPVAQLQVQVKVEYVYEQRNEVQTLFLESGARGWKIARADAGELITAPVRYGTRVK